MGRQIEVTQFTTGEYLANKAGESLPEGNRKRAMLQFAEMMKNGEVDKTLGGQDNIIRIRVLRDSEDTEAKTLTLKFELKNELRVSPQAKKEAMRPPPKKELIDSKVDFPVVIPCVRVYVMSMFATVLANLNKLGFTEEANKLAGVFKGFLQVGAMETENLLGFRHDLMGMFDFLKMNEADEKDIAHLKNEVFFCVDMILALTGVYTIVGPPKKQDVLEILSRMKPQQRPNNRFNNKRPNYANRPKGAPVANKPVQAAPAAQSQAPSSPQ